MSWAELPPQLEEAKQFGITRNICDFILPWRMRGVAGQRGQGAGQHQSSFVLYKSNGRRWGIKCRSRLNETSLPSHAHCEMWANKKHCILFGSRRNINWIFYLKTKANFAGQPEWERAGERRSEEKRWREWKRESGRVRARHCRRLLFCRKMKILIPSGLSAQRPMRPVVVEVGSEVTVNRTSPGGR